jgi:hypothetical protein
MGVDMLGMRSWWWRWGPGNLLRDSGGLRIGVAQAIVAALTEAWSVVIYG